MDENYRDTGHRLYEELLLNSYEARIIYSGYNLFDINKNKEKMPVELKLLEVYERLKALRHKKSKHIFNIAILFFYKWAHSFNTIDHATKANIMPQISSNFKSTLIFLLIFKDLYLFILLFRLMITVMGREGKSDVAAEGSDIEKTFFEQFGALKILDRAYEKLITLLSEAQTKGEMQNDLIETYFKAFNAVDIDYLMEIVELLRDNVFSEDFDDRYAKLQVKILDGVGDIVKNVDKNGIFRKYAIYFADKDDENFKHYTKKGAEVYNLMIFEVDLDDMALSRHFRTYSNINMINVYELLGDETVKKTFLTLDNLFLWHRALVSQPNGSSFLRLANTLSADDGEVDGRVPYGETIANYFDARARVAEPFIREQIKRFLERVPRSDIMSIWSIVEQKILYGLKDYFYPIEKTFIKAPNSISVSSFKNRNYQYLTTTISEIINKVLEDSELRRTVEAKEVCDDNA